MDKLFDEILVNIFCFLNVKDSCHLGKCCKRICYVFCDNDVWRLKLIQKFPWIIIENIPTEPNQCKSYFKEIEDMRLTIQSQTPFNPTHLSDIVKRVDKNTSKGLVDYSICVYCIRTDFPYRVYCRDLDENYYFPNNILTVICTSQGFYYGFAGSNINKNPISIDEMIKFLVENNYRKNDNRFKLDDEQFQKAERMGLIIVNYK